MKVSKEEELWLSVGKPKQIIFKYRVEKTMTREIVDWLSKNFKSFGDDYYYSHGEIWFRKAKHETFFLLRWQ